MPNNSFLPEDYIEKRVARRTNIFSLVLFVVVMGGVIAAFVVTDKQRKDIEAQQQMVNDRFVEAARRIDQLDKLQAQKQQMIAKASVTAVLIERVPRTLVLAELINNMPETMSLTALDVESRVEANAAPARTIIEQTKASRRAKNAKDAAEEMGVPAIEVKPTRTSLRLVGLAPTDVEVAAFMTALGNNDMFTGVTLSFSEEKLVDERRMRNFRIDLEVNPEVQVTDIEPKLVRREGLKHNPMDDPTEPGFELISPTAGQSVSVPVDQE